MLRADMATTEKVANWNFVCCHDARSRPRTTPSFNGGREPRLQKDSLYR
jgi:hypothetical protein